MRAVPRSCWAAKRVLFASEHGTGNKANFDSMVRSHASASRGSSVLWNSGGAGYQRNLDIQVPGEYDHHVLVAESVAGFAAPALADVAARFARP